MPDMQLDKKLRQVSAYQQAVDASSVLSITGTDGVITYVNDHFCTLSQYSSSELIGKTHRIISSDYHGKGFFAAMYETISAGRVWRNDVRNRAKDGSIYWVDMTIVPLKNENGSIEGYVAIDYDITGRKLIKERRFQLLFDNSKDGLLMASPGGAFTEINDTFCSMLGYTREELLKMRREDITVPDDPNLRDGLAIRMRTGHYEGTLKFRRKDGGIIETNISTAIYRDDNGENRSYICIRDITEKVKAELQLHQNKNRLHSMIEHGKDVITLIAADGSIKYRSPSYKTVFGYDPDTMGEDLVLANLHPDDQQSIKELMTDLVNKPGLKIEAKWRQRHANGSYMWMEGSGTNMLDDPEMGAIVLNCRDITEHIKIKEQLERSNAELNRLFNTIDEVVYTVDATSYQLTQMSEAAIKVYGYPASDFITNNQLWYELILPEDRHIPGVVGEHLDRGEAATGQYRIKHKDGSIRWIEATLVPTLDERGKLIRMDGVNRDITEKKIAEEARANADKRFRELIENSKDGIALSSKDRKFTYISPAIREILGYDPEELIGKNTYDYFHPEEQIKTQEFYVNVLGKTSYVPPLVFKARHKDGTDRMIELTASNKLDDPAINAIVTNFRDVTDRINAEQARIDSEKRFLALIENSKDVIALTDKERKIVYMSPAVKGVLGYDRDELIGRSAYDILMDPEEVEQNVAFRKSVAPGQTFTRLTKARHKNGSWRWIESEITNYLENPVINGMLTNFRDVTEKQATKEALLQSERKFRALIENSKDVITMADAQHKIIYISPAIKDVLGYEPGELIGTDSSLTMHPEEAGYNIAIRSRIHPGQTMTILMRAHHKNGSWRWLEVAITNQLNDPAINAIVSNIRDVTEKKGTEEALINSEKKFRALIDNNKDGIALTDSNREFIYLSPSMTDILGYASSELIGTVATDLYHPEDLIEMEKKVSPFVLHRQDHISGLVRMHHKDGSWRWIELTSGNKLDDPAINAIVTNFRDMTDRKNAEEAVLNSEKRFRALIENNKEGIALSDTNRKFTYVSPSVTNILGYAPEELRGMHGWELYHPDDQDSMRDMVKKILEKKIDFGMNTVRIRHKDSTWRWIELTASYQFDDPAVNAMVTNFRDVSEKKKTEEALSNSEKRFRTLIENNQEGISLTDDKSLFVYLSPSAVHILGYNPEELIGTSAFDRYHPEDQPIVREIATHIRKRNGNHANASVRILHKDATWRWIELTATNQLNDPAINAIVTNFRDVTERKNAEQAVKDSEERFRALIEKSREVIVLTDRARKIAYVSPSIQDILGYESGALMGSMIFDLYHPDDQAAMKELVTELIKEPGGHAKHQLRLRHKDGSWRWIEATVSNRLDDPTIQSLIGNLRDITENREAAEAVINSEQKFRALIENGKDGIALTGPDRSFTYLSPQVHSILGFEPDELIGSHPLSLYHPDDHEKIFKFVESIKDKNVPHTIEDLRILCKDGSWKWAELTFCNQFDDPAINALVCNYRDVTDRKNAEDKLELLNQSLEKKVEERTAELQESNKALESFSYMAAHDLQAPLRVLSGYASILKTEYHANLNEDGGNLLDTIVLKTRHMSKLISDMLTFSRVSHAAMNEGEVDLDEMVRGVTDQARLSSGTIANAEIKILPLGRRTCDPGLIQQVWVNLISNAIKYTGKKEDPAIEIGAIIKEAETIYYVKDNGAGFDMKYASNLFEVFKRMHSADEFEGTGIGLALVKSVITRHRGRIWAEAEPDKGATFYFALPD